MYVCGIRRWDNDNDNDDNNNNNNNVEIMKITHYNG